MEHLEALDILELLDCPDQLVQLVLLERLAGMAVPEQQDSQVDPELLEQMVVRVL